MEVGQQAIDVDTDASFHSRVEANTIASERSEAEDQRFPRNILEECNRLCRPENYGGCQGTRAIETSAVSLEAYLRLHSGT